MGGELVQDMQPGGRNLGVIDSYLCLKGELPHLPPLKAIAVPIQLDHFSLVLTPRGFIFTPLTALTDLFRRQ